MKKVCSALLAFALLLVCTVPSHAAQAPTVSPLYVNTTQASVSFAISEYGKANIVVTCVGNSTATKISTVTYLEQKIGSVWVRVAIDSPNNEWLYTTTASFMQQSYDHTVTFKGKYRAVCEFTVEGTIEDETFTLTNTYEYE